MKINDVCASDMESSGPKVAISLPSANNDFSEKQLSLEISTARRGSVRRRRYQLMRPYVTLLATSRATGKINDDLQSAELAVKLVVDEDLRPTSTDEQPTPVEAGWVKFVTGASLRQSNADSWGGQLFSRKASPHYDETPRRWLS